MHKAKITTLLLVVLVIAGVASIVCRNWTLYPGRLITEAKPSEAIFTGYWELEKVCLPSVTNRTGQAVVSAELFLQADGYFIATNFPIEDGFSNPKWRIKSGDGHWELYRHQFWVVSLGFADGFSIPLEIREKNGNTFALTYSVGNPDSNERWVWRHMKK